MIYSEKVIDQMEVQITEQLLEIDELKDRIAELEKEADRLSNHANELRKIHANRIAELESKLFQGIAEELMVVIERAIIKEIKVRSQR